MPAKDDTPSDEALFRYHVLGAIRLHVAVGGRAAEVIARLAGEVHVDLRGQQRRLSARTLYRWLRAYETDGLAGLEPERRQRLIGSRTLPAELLEFCRLEKEQDRDASIPELLDRARTQGVLDVDFHVNRGSLWRVLRRMDVVTSPRRRFAQRDMHRYAYPHRMQMVLCDGKHFRAGVERLRRVVLVFIDDASRYVPEAIVGTSESTEVFLRGLFTTIDEHGLMNALYLDRGPGFIAGDTRAVCARLRVPLLYGEKAYPQGHGKVERFHRTFWDRALRLLCGNPAVDPDPASLSLLLRVAVEQYNQRPHESLDGQMPLERWQQDTRALEPVSDRDWLRDRFRTRLRRRVTRDNIAPVDGVAYEVPRGHAGEHVTLQRSVFDPRELYLPEGDHLIRLYPVDVHANAFQRRHRPSATEKTAPQDTPAVKTAAQTQFNRTFAPIVDDDGGFQERSPDHASNDEPDDEEP